MSHRASIRGSTGLLSSASCCKDLSKAPCTVLRSWYILWRSLTELHTISHSTTEWGHSLAGTCGACSRSVGVGVAPTRREMCGEQKTLAEKIGMVHQQCIGVKHLGKHKSDLPMHLTLIALLKCAMCSYTTLCHVTPVDGHWCWAM